MYDKEVQEGEKKGPAAKPCSGMPFELNETIMWSQIVGICLLSECNFDTFDLNNIYIRIAGSEDTFYGRFLAELLH